MSRVNRRNNEATGQHCVDLRVTNVYGTAVPLKYGKLVAKCPRMYGHLYTVCLHYLRRSAAAAASVAELCRRPSHDSDRSNGLSRTLADRCRPAADEDDEAADSGLRESGDVGRGWSGDA